MKNDIYKRIMGNIDGIIKAIQNQHDMIDIVVDRANIDLSDLLEDDGLSDIGKSRESDRIHANAREKASLYTDNALIDIETAFDQIEADIYRWIAQPIQTDFMTFADAARRFKLQLSPDEIEALSQNAQQAYFSQKVLSALAAESGYDTGFVDASQFKRLLNRFHDDVNIAIVAYSGRITSNQFNAPWITSEDFPLHLRMLANDYLTKDESSLTDFQSAVKKSVDTTVSLMPSQTATLDALFADVAPEDRNEVMQRLISENNIPVEQLRTYDSDLFIDASARLAVKAAETTKHG